MTSSIPSPLNVLLIEEHEEDREIIYHELEKRDLMVQIHRIDRRDEFQRLLEQFKAGKYQIDIILSNYTLPDFGAIEALNILETHQLSIPFIVVSHTMNNEVGGECLHHGADDYIDKDQLFTLKPAVIKTLQRHQDRRDREQAEARNRDHEARFQALIENTSAAIFIIHNEQIYLANPAAEKLTGYSMQELLNMLYIQLVHPDTEKIYQESIHPRNWDNQKRYIYQIRDVDRKLRWIETTTGPITFEGQQALVLTAIDITERQEAEYLLHQTRQFLKSVVSDTPVVLFALDQAGTFKLVEGTRLPFLDITSETAAEQNALKLYRNHTPLVETLKKALQGQEFQTVIDIGNERWKFYYSPFNNLQEQLTGTIGFALDYSHQKEIEKQYQISEEYFSTMFDNALEILLLVDPDGYILRVNDAVEIILQYSPDELLGQSSGILFPDDARIPFEQFLEIVQDKKDVRIQQDFLCKDGKPRTMDVIASLVATEDNAVIVLALHDAYMRILTVRRWHESAARFYMLAENINTALFMYRDNELEYVNPAVKTLTGYSLKKLKDSPDELKFIRPETDKYITLSQILGEQEMLYNQEIHLLTKDKQRKQVLMNIIPVHYDLPEEDQILLVTVFDITPIKTMHERLYSLYEGIASLLQVSEVDELTDHLVKIIEETFPDTRCEIELFDHKSEPDMLLTVRDEQPDDTYAIDQFDAYNPVLPLSFHNNLYGRLHINGSHAFSRVDLQILQILVHYSTRLLDNIALDKSNEQFIDQMIWFIRMIDMFSQDNLQVNKVLDILCEEIVLAKFADYVFAVWLESGERNLVIRTEYPVEGMQNALTGLVLPETQFAFAESVSVELANFTQQINLPNFPDLYQILQNKKIEDKQLHSVTMLPVFIEKEQQNILHGFIGLCYTDNQKQEEWITEHIRSILNIARSALHRNALILAMNQMNNSMSRLVNERLRQKKEQMETKLLILNNVQDAILLLKNQKIHENNQAFYDLFRYNEEEAEKLQLSQFIFEPDIPVIEEAVHTVQDTGETQQIEVRAVRKNRTIFDAGISLSPVHLTTQNDENKMLVCSIRDISRQKDVDRLADDFVRNISHELRTPLQTVVTSTDTLVDYHRQLDPERLEKVIQRLHTYTKELESKVSDILQFVEVKTDIASRNTVNTMVNLNMFMTLEEVIRMQQLKANSKQQELLVELPPDVIFFHGNPGVIRQVWLQLIDNAVKYTPEGSTITARLTTLDSAPEMGELIDPELQTKYDSQKIIIGQVEDNGSGIPEDDLKLIFSRFYRGKASTREIPGMGLGLHMVQNILHDLHGGIHVSSTPDSGSTFTFWLPDIKG